MKYYLIAGEASGDLHASNLMKSLKNCDAQATFRFWGGNLMQAQGGILVHHYSELSFMGFWEVLKNIRTLSRYIQECKNDIINFQPDAVILVDYAGFNLRIAQFAKSQGFQTHFYIAPKVWAWNEARVKKLKKFVDYLYVIFPFEKPYFEEKHQYPVYYFGNPLQDEIENFAPINEKAFRTQYSLTDQPIIALLPGSRTQEIRHILPLMVQTANDFPDYQFVVAGAPNRNYDFYKPFLENHSLAFVPNETYNLLSVSYAALVTSGTATLETALFKVPQVVCYKTSAVSYFIAKNLVRDLKYISLVNLVMDAPVVVELIQHKYNLTNLKKQLSKILQPDNRKEIFEKYLDLENLLGNQGASQKIAECIYLTLQKK